MDKEPTFIPPQESASKRPDFSRAVESLQRMSVRDIGFLDIVSDLEDVKERAEGFSEEEKEKARVALKKILIALPPWRRGANFVSQNLENLAYTPEEQENLAMLRAETEARQAEVEREVAEGASPWLARVKHNEQNALNPVAVGFYQMPDGQIRTIFGSRYFQSKRQIKTEGLFFGGRSEDKEVNLLSTKFQAVDRSEIIRSPLFDLLPEDLRMRIERGEILVTGEKDLYDLSEPEIENLAASKDISAVPNHVENKIANAGKEKQYYLLYQSDYHSDETGRTGVLMAIEDGKAEPVVITVGDKQFVLEIKGCGKKGGGFGRMHHRTGRDIITGGAEREQAVNEFDRLSEMADDDAPKAVASILFDNHGYQQGYILRLTPSTIRASYSSNEVYPAIDSPEQVSEILDVYTQELAEQVFAPNPKILDRSSHSENILLWGDGKHTFTDFSDHVAFSDTHYPHEESHGGYMTPRQMLEYYIKMVEEIPGYQAERDKKLFLQSLKTAFAQKGYNVSLEENEDYAGITKRLWEGGIAYQVFSARRSNNYRAEGVVEEFRKSVTDEYHQRELSLASEQDFVEKYESGFQKILTALDILQRVEADSSKMSRIRGLVESKDLPGLLKNLDQIYKVWQEGKNLNEDEKRNIYEAISYFSGLEYTLIRVVKRYLEHEHDVIFSAESSAPTGEQTVVGEARKEIDGKMQELETTLGNPQDLFRKFTDPNWVKSFVSLNCYHQ
ncbi:MAG: hypothetical protein PHS62_03125 [Patescibacteria group bacterium]|nr:hypothetical protein [Patescibacteria group bacterium]